MQWKLGETVHGPIDAEKLMRPLFKRHMTTQEVFLCVALNAQQRPIGKPWIVALGTVSAVTVHPRDVYRDAVRRNASAVIVAHNHPSGNASPSGDDIALTGRLRDAGELIGIPLIDHLVLTTQTCRSII
jgi:DNA repair protein RadC